jgi:RNA polymerase sigma-70 factor (ECF subfamily)
MGPNAGTDSAKGHREADWARARAILDGDEKAFEGLVREHQSSLRRLVRPYLGEASADEIVQDTWAAFLEGLERYEGRSSLKTWLCGICLNLARARSRRERRQVPFSALEESDGPEGAVLVLDQLHPEGHHWAGFWRAYPGAWPVQPDAALFKAELLAKVEEGLDVLPLAQREVFLLRDVEGLSGEETCNVLGVTDTHQRVLLHRARARIRAALQKYFDEAGAR